MKKKLLIIMLALIMTIASAFALTACGETNGDGNGGGNSGGGNSGGGDNTQIDVKAEFTVTFDANGGAFADSAKTKQVKVLDGDTVDAVPENPVREGYAFAGWYVDANGSAVWIASGRINGNITVYAVWNITERDVKFVLNYPGAKTETRKTKDGLVRYVPERDGYVFNGWWLSEGKTGDGYILSQKFDEKTVITTDDLVLYAEWVAESKYANQLNAPSISIKDYDFKWEAVADAQSYNVRVYQNGSEQDSYSVNSTSWSFPSYYDPGYYTVRIRAIGDGYNYVNSEYAIKNYAYNILTSTDSIVIDVSTSVLTWSPVKNATNYSVSLNRGEAKYVSYASFDMSEYPAGEYQITAISPRIPRLPASNAACSRPK